MIITRFKKGGGDTISGPNCSSSQCCINEDYLKLIKNSGVKTVVIL